MRIDYRLEYPLSGIHLAQSLIAGASPLADDLDSLKRLEDAGAPALVLRSLFEEQITNEQMAEHFPRFRKQASVPRAILSAEARLTSMRR